jgi:hypothetical protein
MSDAAKNTPASTAEARDAARYRWLRTNQVLAWKLTGDRRATFEASTGKKLDTCIDIALATAPQTGLAETCDCVFDADCCNEKLCKLKQASPAAAPVPEGWQP